MAFKDYSTTPATNTSLADGTYVGPNMLRNKVRPAFQQIMADGRDLYNALAAIALDSTAAIFTATGTGAATRSIGGKLRDTVNVKDFGAVGDGVTNDTAAFTAAIAAGHKRILVPKGNYLINSLISLATSGIKIIGDGKTATIITQAVLGTGVFDMVGSHCSIEDLSIIYNGQGTVGGTAINVAGSFYGSLKNVYIYRAYRGVHYKTAANSHSANHVVVEDATFAGVEQDGVFNILWNHCWIINSNITTLCTSGCIRQINQVEGCDFTDIHTFMGVSNLVTDAATNATGSRPSFNKFTNVYFDASAGSSINNSAEMDFIDCWFSARGTGLDIANADGIRFSGGNVINCNTNGIVVEATAKRVSFNGVSVRANGVTTANTYDGIVFAVGATDFAVRGCTFTNAGVVYGTQRFGVNVLAGASDRYIIADNLVTGNGTGGVNDGGSGTNKRVANNY